MTYDIRDGGAWRYVHRDADGSEYGFHGVFHGDAVAGRWSRPSSSRALRATCRSTRCGSRSADGRTVIRAHSVFQSVEDRDAMVENGMADGVNEGFARLDELLATLSPTPVN